MPATPGPENEIVAFEFGRSAGEDPQPTHDELGAGGQAVTHSSSPWNHRLCQTCGHTFRRGDRVIRDLTSGQVRHLDPALRCAVLPDDGQPEDQSAESAAFSAGLLAEWPPSDHVRVVQLTADDWQVARPGSASRPAVCVDCGHTFRAGEWVVICPCRPHDPGCGAAIHRDPAVGLPCWERWRPAEEVTVCPVRQIRVNT